MNIITYLFGLLLQRRVVLSCVIYSARFLYIYVRRIVYHLYRKCIKSEYEQFFLIQTITFMPSFYLLFISHLISKQDDNFLFILLCLNI